MLPFMTKKYISFQLHKLSLYFPLPEGTEYFSRSRL